ncbi:MAG: restriction endonuclease subunit S, partial [Pseudomonadota bacterium]
MAEMKAGYKQTDIGIIPEDWDVITFNALADPNDSHSITGGPFGSNLQSKDYTPKGIRIIQLQNIGDGVFHDNYEIFTSTEKADELRSCNVYPGDIILSKMGDSVARAALVPSANARYLMCSDGIRLKVNKQRNSELYIFYYINFSLFRKLAEAASTGSTRKRIGLSDLRKLPIIAPQPKEQKQIAAALSDIDGLIEALSRLIAKKRDMKTAAMQQLLTGQKRLPGFDGEWKSFALRDLATIRNQKTNTLNNSIAQYCIELENIATESGSVLFSSDATGRKLTKYIFKKGDVLFGRLRPYLKKFWNAKCEGVCSTEIWPLMPLSND